MTSDAYPLTSEPIPCATAESGPFARISANTASENASTRSEPSSIRPRRPAIPADDRSLMPPGEGELVPVLERLWAFEQEHDRAPLGDRSVFDASGNDDDVARGELDGVAILVLDPQGALPAQEQLVLVVVVPGELPLDRRDPDDRVVHGDEVPRLERPVQPARRL